MNAESPLAIISDTVPPTVWLVQSLASCDQDVIVHALRRPTECSLRREGLHTVVKLLKDPRGKVSASASSALRSLAAQPRQREQVRGHWMCAQYVSDTHNWCFHKLSLQLYSLILKFHFI